VRVIRTLLLVVLAGCSPPAAQIPTHVPPEPTFVSGVFAAEGVTEMERLCDDGADERCDGLDSDCDLHIDEGCEGARAGDVEIAVAWSAGDVELAITGDAGAGEAVIDARACDDPLLRRATIASSGGHEYELTIAYGEACGHEGPITASVTIATQGEVHTYNRTLAPGERASIARVGVP
jgi:hypothetical protein